MRWIKKQDKVDKEQHGRDKYKRDENKEDKRLKPKDTDGNEKDKNQQKQDKRMSGDERWNVKAASYAWVVGGVQGGNQDKHEYGGMGGMGMVDGNRATMDSYRAELKGLAAAMARLKGRWKGEVVHRLDNKAVVDVYHRIKYMQEEDMIREKAGDLWGVVKQLWEGWEGRYKVQWMRGHPEKGEHEHKGKGGVDTKEGWDRHDHANHFCDRQADAVYHQAMRWGDQIDYPTGSGIRVWMGGRRLQQQLQKAVRSREDLKAVQQAVASRVTWGWDKQSGDKVKMEQTSIVKLMDWDVMQGGWKDGKHLWGRIRQAKLMWGWMATQRMLWHRGEVDTARCPLCGTDSEDNWHMRTGCKHKDMIRIRREGIKKLRTGMDKIMKRGGLGVELRDAMCLMWALDKDGTMMQWEGMVDKEWEQWDQQTEWLLGQHWSGAGMEAVDKDKVKEWMAKLSMQQPAEMRQQGWLWKQWVDIWRGEGMNRGVAEELSNEMVVRCDEMWEEMWGCRVKILHQDSESVIKERDEWHNKCVDKIGRLALSKDTIRFTAKLDKTEGIKRMRQLHREVQDKVRLEEGRRKRSNTIEKCWNKGPLRIRVKVTTNKRRDKSNQTSLNDWATQVVGMDPQQLDKAPRISSAGRAGRGVKRRSGLDEDEGEAAATAEAVSKAESTGKRRKRRATQGRIDSYFGKQNNNTQNDSLDSRTAAGLSITDRVQIRQAAARGD